MPESVTAEELDYVQPDRALIDLAVDALTATEWAALRVVTAESCTGGVIATVLSEAGAAQFFEGAFVCYTSDHKCAGLGLEPALIERHGAVSAEGSTAMAEPALQCSNADIAISVTGVAGPDKDEDGKPVGLVYLACARIGASTVPPVFVFLTTLSQAIWAGYCLPGRALAQHFPERRPEGFINGDSDRRFVVIVVSPAAVTAWASPPQETDSDQTHVGRLVLVVLPWAVSDSHREEYSQSVAAITAKALRNINGSILIPGITYLALRG
jgi:nicotinamide-nucleotide amidase